MTTDAEIKDEMFEIDDKQCRSCLSIGRKMLPLGKYVNLFQKLVSNCSVQNISRSTEIAICWECYALLKKVVEFRKRVDRANEILHSGENLLYGTLSKLTTVVLNDTHTHTIYIMDNLNTPNFEQTDTQSKECYEAETDTQSKQEQCYESEHDFEDNGATEHIDVNIEVREEISNVKKPKLNNKWAKKRALQNKKPKFKIVTDNLINILFHKANNETDSEDCLMQERDSCKSTGFEKRTELMEHVRTGHTKVHESCDVSQRKPKDQLTHRTDSNVEYHCRLCNFIGHNKISRGLHIKEHSKVLQCLKCNLLFGNRQEFFKHFKDWHEKFICDYCGVSFKMRYCIKNHIRKQHSPFECKQCDKKFARYNGLWLHNKTRHTATGDGAYCVECDARYPDRYRYRWHLANSVRHRPRLPVRIPCPGCDKVFSKNIYMKDHYNLVHLKQYKYRCEECDKNFIRNADLVKHRRRVHEGILPPKNKICYICGRGFTTNKILSNHIRTHTGERPFACVRCPARFAQAVALAGHVRALHHH